MVYLKFKMNLGGHQTDRFGPYEFADENRKYAWIGLFENEICQVERRLESIGLGLKLEYEPSTPNDLRIAMKPPSPGEVIGHIRHILERRYQVSLDS